MLGVYQALANLALKQFDDIVTGVTFVGGTPAIPNKLRLTLIDGSFLDIWLSADGDYAYHWEQRQQSGSCIGGITHHTIPPLAHTLITCMMATSRQSLKVI